MDANKGCRTVIRNSNIGGIERVFFQIFAAILFHNFTNSNNNANHTNSQDEEESDDLGISDQSGDDEDSNQNGLQTNTLSNGESFFSTSDGTNAKDPHLIEKSKEFRYYFST